MSKNSKFFIVGISIQILAFFLSTVNGWLDSDLGIWFNAIDGFKQGKIPYLTTNDFVIGPSEYPVCFTYFLLLFYLIPNLSFYLFGFLFRLIQFLFAALIIFTLFKLIDVKRRVFVLFACPIFLLLSLVRFDLMPVSFLLFSYYFARKKEPFIAGFFLAIASLLKLFPVVYLFGFYFIKRLNYRKFLTSFLLTILIAYLPVIFLQPTTILYPFSFISVAYRKDSLFGMFRLLFDLPLMLATIYRYAVLVLISFSILLKLRKPLVIGASFTIMLMVTSPIFSPQWTLWVMPILLLINFSPLLLIVFDVITFLQYLSFRLFFSLGYLEYSKFMQGGVFSVSYIILTILRYVFLFYFFYFLIKKHSKRAILV